MRERVRMLTVTIVIGGLLAAPAAAQPHVDATLRAGQGPGWLPGGTPGSTGRVELLVRLRDADAFARVEALGNRGVRVARAEGAPLRWRDWVLVRADARGVDALRASTAVRSLHVAPPAGRPPLDRSRMLLGVDGARGAAGVSDRLTGRGVVVADLDSHVDVFHPDFFYGDAGWFDWIDTDGDGAFTAGVDAVDLDRDGEASEAEVGRVLRGAHVDFYGNPTDPLTQPTFDPAVDWIYLDTDGDGERSFGAADGFDDDDPAFGEPLFVPDDVDRDGRLEPHERLVRLGGSKLRASYVRLAHPSLPAHDHVYRRGVDLSATPGDLTGGVYGYSDTLHATGVLGILAGGVNLPSRRFVGVAPDAELLNAFELGETDAARTMWTYMQEPDVILHEYVLWTRIPLDGSDVYSTLIDESTASGVAHVCPAGNIGGAGKHTEVALGAGETAERAFEIPADTRQVELSIHGVGEGELVVEVLDDAGGVYPLEERETAVPAGDGAVYGSGETTERSTQVRYGILVEVDTSAAWRLRVRAEGGPLTVHGFLADERSGFSRGAAWTDAVEASTVAAPATADACLSVGSVPAYTASEGPWYERAGVETALQVRDYSARGPRIDGAQRPHVVAPDNPWSALSHGDLFPSRPGIFVADLGSYAVFGGTSGAGPHAAGLAALLVQSGLRGADVVDRIVERSVVDPVAGEVPNDAYGHGRIHAASALDGVVDGAAPTITLRAEPAIARPGQTIRLIPEADDPDGDAVELRWDDAYDGAWDTEYGAVEPRTVSFSSEGRRRWKVRARDATGRVAEASVSVVVDDEPPPPPDAGVPADDAAVPMGDAGPGGDDGGGDGCGCHAAGRPGSSAPFAALALVGLVAARRSRRRR